jgi:hypothetical protein
VIYGIEVFAWKIHPMNIEQSEAARGIEDETGTQP